MTATLLITYRVVSHYGTEALASLGIGFRIVPVIYLPSVAICDAMAAIVGQNIGAKQYSRVVSTFWMGIILGMAGKICYCCPGNVSVLSRASLAF